MKWEESNPLEFEDKDKTTLISRIQGVYRKAAIRMRFYAEIWFVSNFNTVMDNSSSVQVYGFRVDKQHG